MTQFTRTELFIENAEQASLLADHNPSLLSTRKLESLHQKRQLKSKIAQRKRCSPAITYILGNIIACFNNQFPFLMKDIRFQLTRILARKTHISIHEK